MLYVYIGCLTFALLYSVLATVFSAHGFDHSAGHGGAGHAGADHADTPSPFNPLVIASAIATFGAVGLIGKLGFKMGDLISSLVSLGFAGAIGAGIFYGIVKVMYGSQSDSTFSLSDLVGSEAEVLTPIPAKGMGEIVCIVNGERHTLTAKTEGGEIIPRGEGVRIKDITGSIALVTHRMTLDDIDFSKVDESLAEKDRITKNQNKNIKEG